MAKHKMITIKVAYDDVHEVPNDEMLKSSIESFVGDGMLNPDHEADTIIEAWSVEVTDVTKE